MARKKIEVNCPYCEGTFAASGMTAHVRHKHPEKYEEFKANRATIIEKNKIVEGEPAPEETPLPPTEPAPEDPPEPEKTPAPAPKQKSAGFLGSVGKALRDW